MQNTSSEIDLDEIYQNYQCLIRQFNTLLLATVDEEGIPNASYAPYVQEQGDYYIYISELAVHTGNILKNSLVSVLFIENEEQAQHLFARQRVTYQCEAFWIPRDSEHYRYILSLFSAKFGSIMKSLQDKRDFHLFKIHPVKGTFVAGFGRAFTLDGENLKQIRHINEKGHRASAHQPELQGDG